MTSTELTLAERVANRLSGTTHLIHSGEFHYVWCPHCHQLVLMPLALGSTYYPYEVCFDNRHMCVDCGEYFRIRPYSDTELYEQRSKEQMPETVASEGERAINALLCKTGI